MAELTTITFSDLSIWDVKNYFRQQDTFNESYPLVLFGEFLNKPIVKKTKIDDDNEYRILGVRSYGKGAYINRIVKGNSLKMRTYQIAPIDHLFWCKVDTKNGAFGIIDENLANGVASSNMTFAEINKSKANTEYVQLLFTSPKVNQYMDGYVTGSTNRKYIKPNQLLEEVKIPLPPLPEQNRIVTKYNQKIQLADEQEEQANNLKKEIEEYVIEKLGVGDIDKKIVKLGLKLINYKDIIDWGFNMDTTKFQSKIYKTLALENSPSLYREVFRGKSPKYDHKAETFILNQKCNRWNYIELEYVKKVDEKWFNSIDKKFFTKSGDILINSTGDGTIGRATCITDKFENLIYDSHLLLLRLDQSKVNPLYFTYLFNSKYGQLQVESIKSAQSTKQSELGVTNLKKIMFPFPTLEVQDEIANHITGLKSQIKALQSKAKQNREQALQNFEKEIFS